MPKMTCDGFLPLCHIWAIPEKVLCIIALEISVTANASLTPFRDRKRLVSDSDIYQVCNMDCYTILVFILLFAMYSCQFICVHTLSKWIHSYVVRQVPAHWM